MSNICPFMSSTSGNYDLVTAECVEGKCKFWNEEENECWLLLSAKKQAVGNDAELNSIEEQLNELNEKVETLKTDVGQNTHYIEHFHQQHLHNYPHKVEEMDDREGAVNIAMIPDAATVLAQEYQSGRDVDGNGLIYGVDFTIDRTDPNKPLLLQIIENNENWKEPELKVTFIEYLESMGWFLRYPVEEEE